MTLISRVSPQINQDLIRNEPYGSDTQDNYCFLVRPCNTPDYQVLWEYYLKIQFNFAGKYTDVNIGSFAYDNTYSMSCILAIDQLLPQADSSAMTKHVVLGSMWLQNFVALFEYSYSPDEYTALYLTPSATALPGTAIDFSSPTQSSVSAFTYAPANQTIEIYYGAKNMTASILANFGF